MKPKTLTSRLARNGDDLEAALATEVGRHATDEQMAARRQAEAAFVESMHPVTVRQVLYHMEVHHPDMIGKDDYKMVAKDLADLRENGAVPYSYIIDNTRRTIRGYAYNSVCDGLQQFVEQYRTDIWANYDCLVQIWIEKDALAEVLTQTVLKYNVPLMVARGWSSLSFLHKEAQPFIGEERPIYIYHLADYDADGQGARDEIEAKLGEFAPGADINFIPLGVTAQQIRDWRLPTREPNRNSSRAAAWGNKRCAELDAIPPDKLRDLVEGAINNHMTEEDKDRLEASNPDLEKVRELIEELES
jgi:hypothetical protein